MSEHPYLHAILGFSLLNGIFSPFIIFMVQMTKFIAPAFFISSPLLLIYISNLLLSTLTIMLAGIPAAIYERITGQESTNKVSWWIWMAGTALLSLPAVINAVGYLTS